MKKSNTSLFLAILFCIGALVLAVLILLRYRQLPQTDSLWSRSKVVPAQPVLTSSPSLTTPQTTKVHSSDGTLKLVMGATVGRGNATLGNTTLYDFTVSDISGSNSKMILTHIVGSRSNESMTIPVNTFSPDNKYVFLQLNTGGPARSAFSPAGAGGQVNYFVVKVSGEAFAKGQKYLDVGELFKQKLPDLKMTGATGWAGNTLLIVKTAKPDGQKGFSYWFDVSSSSFLQLSS